MTPREIWQWFPWNDDGAAQQLQTSDALCSWLASSHQPAIRWYHVKQPALIAGVGQSLDDFDPITAQEHGITMHRRASGGAAVLMTTDFLMLDVALPANHRLLSPDVTHSYRWFGEIWVAALALCGIHANSLSVEAARAAQLSKDDLARRVCFGGRSPYEIVVHERKLVGFSQIRRRSGALLQAGCYMHWQPELLVSLLSCSPGEKTTLVARLQSLAIGLADLPASPSFSALITAFAIALQTNLDVIVKPNPDGIPPATPDPTGPIARRSNHA